MDEPEILIRRKARDPKPTSSDSWWIGLGRTALQAEALRRWPAATSGEKFSGVMFQAAGRHGTI